MSTVANHETMKAKSKLAPVAVGFMAVSAAALLIQSAAGTHEWHRWEFVGLLLASAVSSRFKVKLPGLNGNMSVSLPFIFMAMTQLSMVEALMVAGVSVFVQTIPKAPHQFVPIQALFNIATALVAAGLGSNALWFGLHSRWNPALCLVLGCAMHLLTTSLAVATIISVTDNRRGWPTWSNIFHLAFPYYLASTGLASIAAGLGGHTSWPMLVGVACVMFVTYRSYRLYFAVMRNSQDTATASVKSAAAGL